MSRVRAGVTFGFLLGCLFWAACGKDGSRAIANIIDEALEIVYDNSASGLLGDTVQEAIDELAGKTGDLAALQTSQKATLVAAVNEVQGEVGDLATLATSTTTSAVGAINEVNGRVGALTGLATTAQGSLVAAVNEVQGEIGALTSLSTTAKTSLVAAANELKSNVGTLTGLATTAQGSLVAAVNEVQGEVGDLTALSTTAKASLVAALNEARASAGTVFAGSTDSSVGGGTKVFCGSGALSQANNAEGVELLMPRAGSVGNLHVKLFAITTDVVDARILVNGVATSVAVSIPAGSAALFVDADMAAVQAGDLVVVEISSPSATNTVSGNAHVSFELR